MIKTGGCLVPALPGKHVEPCVCAGMCVKAGTLGMFLLVFATSYCRLLLPYPLTVISVIQHLFC